MRTPSQLFAQNAAHNLLIFLLKTHQLTYLSHFKTDLRLLLPNLDASSIDSMSVFSTKCLLYEAFKKFVEEIFSGVPDTSSFADFWALIEYVPSNQTEDIPENIANEPINVEDPELTVDDELSTMRSAVDLAARLNKCLDKLDDKRIPESIEDSSSDNSVEDVEDSESPLSSTLELSVVEIPVFLFQEDPVPTTSEDQAIIPITPSNQLVAVTDNVPELDVENVPLQLASLENLQENLPSPISSPSSKKRKLDVVVPCDTCSYTSSTKSHTKRHQDAKHRGIKNHVCFCWKSFSTKQNLKNHVKIHVKTRSMKTNDLQ